MLYEEEMYLFFADCVIVIHLLFIVFVVAGGLIVLRKPHLAWVHVPAAVWGAVVEFSGWICPLTPLENYLRLLGGGASYSGDFIERYIVPLIYPAGLNAATQSVLGGVVIAINLTVYGFLLIRCYFRKP